MQISKKSWLYKIAYRGPGMVLLSYGEPTTVNLCRFFWRCVLYVPTFYLFIVPLALAGFGLLYFLSPLFGYWFKLRRLGFVEIAPDKWPKIKGYRIWPISVLGLGFLIYVFYTSLAVETFGWVFLGAFVVLSIILLARLLRSDFYQVVRSYIKAKKEKFCPYIEFTND